jgi:DNA-binding MarR family transcriptional regulator
MQDRRLVTISTTEKGLRIMLHGKSNREKQLLKLIEPLDRKEIEILEQASNIVSDRLERIMKKQRD